MIYDAYGILIVFTVFLLALVYSQHTVCIFLVVEIKGEVGFVEFAIGVIFYQDINVILFF